VDFVLKQTPGSYDISLGSLQVKDIHSHDMVQMINYDSEHPKNRIAAVQQIISTVQSHGSYVLNADNSFGDIQITDQFYFNKTTSDTYPLWYVHPLTNLYFNSRSQQREKTVVIRKSNIGRDRFIGNIIPSNENYVLVLDSVSITGSVSISDSDYIVNYGRGQIVFTEAKAAEIAGATEGTVTIRYTLVPIDIKIVSPVYSFERVELLEYDEFPGYFVARILSTTRRSLHVTFKQAERITKNKEEIEERTISQEVFTKVSESQRVAILASSKLSSLQKRVSSVVEDDSDLHIKVHTSNRDTRFAISAADFASTKIKLRQPYGYSFSHDWYPEITNGSFEEEGYTYTVDPLEHSNNISKVIETAEILTSTEIVLPRNAPRIYRDASRNVGGLSLTTPSGGSYTVDAVDMETSMAYLSRSISTGETVSSAYFRDRDSVPASHVSLNPLDIMSFSNQNIRDNVIVYLLSPSDSGFDLKSSVWCMVLPRYNSSNLPIEYQFDNLNININTADDTIRLDLRNNIVGCPAPLLRTDVIVRLQILGIVYVANPLDEDGFLIEDARIYGGGTATPGRSFHDYSRYDGEATDLSTRIILQLPQEYLDDMVDRAKVWDPESVKSDDPDETAYQRAMESVRSALIKFTQLGTEKEIEVE